MKARPILFSTEMINALLDGRKTQTRRVVKVNHAGRAQLGGRNWHIDDPDAVRACPYGVPGDLLWVREAHYIIGEHPGPRPGSRWTHYRADGSNNQNDPAQWHGPWKPGIHMPRHASRLTLRLTDVRVQRVQEIGLDDTLAEGAPRHDHMDGAIRVTTWPTDWYRSLWESLNAARGYEWNANPWVWAISFEVIKANVDRVLNAANQPSCEV